MTRAKPTRTKRRSPTRSAGPYRSKKDPESSVIVLAARQAPSHVHCTRCSRTHAVTEAQFGRVLEIRRLLAPPPGWRLWLCVEKHTCGGEHWYLLCDRCAGELLGNEGNFVEANRKWEASK